MGKQENKQCQVQTQRKQCGKWTSREPYFSVRSKPVSDQCVFAKKNRIFNDCYSVNEFSFFVLRTFFYPTNESLHLD